MHPLTPLSDTLPKLTCTGACSLIGAWRVPRGMQPHRRVARAPGHAAASARGACPRPNAANAARARLALATRRGCAEGREAGAGRAEGTRGWRWPRGGAAQRGASLALAARWRRAEGREAGAGCAEGREAGAGYAEGLHRETRGGRWLRRGAAQRGARRALAVRRGCTEGREAGAGCAEGLRRGARCGR